MCICTHQSKVKYPWSQNIYFFVLETCKTLSHLNIFKYTITTANHFGLCCGTLDIVSPEHIHCPSLTPAPILPRCGRKSTFGAFCFNAKLSDDSVLFVMLIWFHLFYFHFLDIIHWSKTNEQRYFPH